MENKTSRIFKSLQKNKYLKLFPDFKEEKTQKITSLALTLIALSFFGFFAINPTLSTITKLNKELKDDKYVDQQLQTKINDLSMLQEKYNSLQNDLPDILSAIPVNPEVPTLMAQLQSIAQASSIKVNGIQAFTVAVDTGSTSKKYSSFNFALTGSGSYDQVSSFITSLNSMRRIVSSDLISLTKRSGDDNSLQLNYKGSAYFKAQ